MTDTPEKTEVPDLAALAGLAGEWTEAAVATQAMALGLLQVELQGLADQMTGGAEPRSAEELRKVDAEVEAAFDNMPV